MSLSLRLRALDPRAVLTALLIACLCASFWLGSRYPSLQGKAGSDPDAALATPLGFEQYFAEPAPHQTGRRILWTAMEWAATNRQGMLFGVLLAAGMLSLLPLLPASAGGRFSGALRGTLIGAPMGVCVNCAAPVGQAMLHAGGRVETALATMFASPSFNAVVLGMVLSLFPPYLAALKIGASLLMVLLVVPWLAQLAERPGWRQPLRPPPRLPGLRLFKALDNALGAQEQAPATGTSARTSWGAALLWLPRQYLINLWRVVKLAVPLMLLAGLLGAVLVELLPWSRLSAVTQVDGVLANLLVLLLVCAFGVLLPVPIAFDVIICAVLLDAGASMPIVAALLVTLGLYSVYPWSVLGVSLSWRIASLAGLAVLLLGLAAGGTATLLQRWHELQETRQSSQYLAALPRPAAESGLRLPGRSAEQLDGVAPPLMPYTLLRDTPGLKLAHRDFRPASPATGATAYVRTDASALGFQRLPLRRPYTALTPGVMHLGALAAGDIDGDGWPDVAVGSPYGVQLYRNLGGRFALQHLDFEPMRDWMVSDLALVDLDGDGQLDLYFNTWMHGGHVLMNLDGAFASVRHLELPRGQETAVRATAFADFDRDGDLDIVTGASAFVPRFFYPEDAVNRLWINEGDHFRPSDLAGPQGETLSLLAKDLDGDGWTDLLVGNDFDEPDRIYRNHQGQLLPVGIADSPIPYSTTTTMSLDAGDLDNDGREEIYISEIAMGRVDDLSRRMVSPLQACEAYELPADRSRCDRLARFQSAVVAARLTDTVSRCESLTAEQDRRDCVVSAHHWNRIMVRFPVMGAGKELIAAQCERIPEDFVALHDICTALRDNPMDYNRSDRRFPEELPSIKHTNLLFAPGADGRYEDVTERWNAGFGGWSWNARFADMDNDGWQDLLVAQGTRLRPSGVSALAYRNLDGQGFAEVTADWGLVDHRPTGAYLHLDLDLDGDLDVLSYPFFLSPVLWRNEQPRGSGLELRLDDRSGRNRSAIGAQVRIHAADGRVQLRHIRASGGYQSHDLPVARFGLGNWPEVQALSVVWPDGLETRIDALALQGGQLLLTRY